MNDHPPTLVNLGDLILDVVVAARLPLAPATDTPGSIRFRIGGSAANTARAFAREGGRALFVGAVGDDALGRRLVDGLRAEGVEAHVARTGHPTPRLVAFVSPDGERTFVTDRGAADHLSPDGLRPAWFRGATGLHLPAYSLLSEPLADAALHGVGLARAAGAVVSVDLASRGPLLARGRDVALSRLAAASPDLLFANESEASALASRTDRHDLLDIAPVVVIKQGARGCRILRWGGSVRAVDGRSAGRVLELTVTTTPLPVDDSTGAGDAFDAGFLSIVLGADDPHAALGRAAVLRRAARAGHRAARRLLSGPRTEIHP